MSIIQLLKPYKKELIIGPLCKLIEAICELALPLCLARLINDGILKHQSSVIIHEVMTMLFISIIGLIFVLICQKIASHVSLSFGETLRNQLFSQLMKKTNNDKQSITLLNNDTVQVQFAVAMFIRLAIRAPFICVASIVMAYIIQPTISLIFIVATILCFSIIIMLTKQNIPHLHHIQQKLATLNHSLFEILSGHHVIITARKEDEFENKLNQQSEQINQIYEQYNQIESKMTPATTLILNSAMIVLLGVSFYFTKHHQLAVGNIIALSNYLTQMLLALVVITNLMITFAKAYVSYQRISIAFNDIDDETTDDTITDISCQTITLNHIDYRYNSEEPLVLNDLSLTLTHGKDIAITGPVGSGKTTLLKLMTRQVIEQSGDITINQCHLNNKQIQSYFSYVPQQATLFKQSIRQNLLLANPQATEQQLWQVLQWVCLDEFVQKVGLDFILDYKGTNLSGGQRQRLAIARALLKKDIRFLVMDNPFSALDFKTETMILNNIRQHLPQVTLIVSSQHHKTLRQFQHIVVIEHGKVTGWGCDKQLKQTNDYYQQLIAKGEKR